MSVRRAWLAGVAVAAVLLASAGAFALAGPRADAVSGYRAYLDPEGAIVVLAADPAPPGGPITVSEARAGLARTLAGIPSASAAGAIAELLASAPDPELLRVVSSGVGGDGAIVSSYSAYLLAPTGMQLLAERVGGTDLWYDPPMTVLPESTEPGTTWSEAGTVSGVATYTMEGRLEEGTRDGCIRTLTRSVLALDGEEVRSLGQDTEWCLGQGSVSAVDLDNGLRVTVPDPPVTAPPLSAVPPPPAPTETGGLPLVAVSVRIAPAVTGGGIVLANATSGDVLLAAPPVVEGTVPVSWIQHPGGEVLGLTADEAGPVVGTTRREIVALDRAGRWSWTARVPEAAAGDPVIIGSVVVVALLDGTIVGLDRASGARTWTARMSDAVRAGPVRAGDRVVVADIAGEVAAFSEAGRREWTADTGPVLTALTPAADGSVAVADRDGRLTLVDGDGGTRWSAPLTGRALGSGAVAGSVIVVPSASGLQAHRRDDGELAWALPVAGEAAVWSTPVGDDVLVTTTGLVRRVSAAGEPITDAVVNDRDGAPADGLQVVWLGDVPTAVAANGAFLPLADVMVDP